MAWELSFFSLLLGLAASISTATCFIVWRRREKQGSEMFLLLMVGATVWAVGNTLQLMAADLQLKLLFRTVAYVGHNIAPVALLAFALVFTGHSHWITRRNLVLLAAEPMVVALVVTPTNALGWHNFIWTTSSLETVDQLVVLERSFGAWYWLNTAYNYALVLIALYLILFLAVQSQAAARKQGLALLVGVIPPFFANIAWILGITPIDFSPVAFTITGLVFAVAIYRYRLFDIVPVARETVLDAMDDGYVVLDKNGHVTDINDTARQHASVSENPIGRPVAEVLPRCMDLVNEYRTTTANGALENAVTGDIRVVDANENPHYFEVQVSSISRAQFTGCLILMRNITEQRTVEQWYQALIENASDLVAVIDEDGCYTYHSPSSSQILGYDPDELVGEPFEQFIHPDDREEVLEKFDRAVANSEYQPSHEFRFRHSDGTWLWIESRGRNQLDHPLIDGIVINSREITERKEHESALRQHNDRLQALASVASHDLRNPLQLISGRLPLARETGDDKHFKSIEDATDRMETLVEDIVTLAKEGKLVKNPEPVDIAEIATQTWNGIQTKDANLVIGFESKIAHADRGKLRSIFENLFTNAIQHGGSDVTIRVGDLPDGFYVEDDGEGIPSEARSQIFERGFSTERQGSGLGLPIVQSIIMAHGWDVSLTESTGWTRFEITGVEPVDEAERPDSPRLD